MKIILISPQVRRENTYGEFSFAAPKLVSLGLCTLSAYIKKKHPDAYVKVIDCNIESISEEEVLEKIKKQRPRIIGITSTTAGYNSGKSLLAKIKKIDKKIIAVMGGPHISSLPKEVMEGNKDLDFGVIGEGEISFSEIVEWCKGEREKKNIDGVIYRENGRIISCPQKKVIENLDELPFPDLDEILRKKASRHTPIRSIKDFSMHLVTSRGCPFRCSHCEQAVFGSVYRSNSVRYIIDEIRFLKRRYGIDSIAFEDDSFVVNRKKMLDFCSGLNEERLKISWSCSIRNELLDKEMLAAMKKAGCSYIYFGIESGNQDMLKMLNKSTALEKVEGQVAGVKKAGIKVHGSFVIGLPGETPDMIEETIAYSLKLPLDSVTFNLFVPFPKTYLREMAFAKGKVSPDWDSYSDHSPVPSFVPEGMAAEELLGYQKAAYRRFYTRPTYILKHIYYIRPDMIRNSITAFFRLSKK